MTCFVIAASTSNSTAGYLTAASQSWRTSRRCFPGLYPWTRGRRVLRGERPGIGRRAPPGGGNSGAGRRVLHDPGRSAQTTLKRALPDIDASCLRHRRACAPAFRQRISALLPTDAEHAPRNGGVVRRVRQLHRGVFPDSDGHAGSWLRRYSVRGARPGRSKIAVLL